MKPEFRNVNIIDTFKMLKGNTRVSVIFEPLWGIPFVLYSFYLSLYMKGQGITPTQIGYLISIGFISSIICSMFGGVITDYLGRRKTTLIFDFIAWPVSLLIYLISENFWMFACAQAINGFVKIPAVSWNLMVVEDANPQEQVAAYNVMNAINISVGILTPLAGIFIKHLGIIHGERILIGFAVISMTAMILLRHHYYRETTIGREILGERKQHLKKETKKGWKLDFSPWRTLKSNPKAISVLALSILFNAYLPIGTYLSLYYAPFLTEVLKLGKSAIAILGGINAAVLLFLLIFWVPRLSYAKRFSLMITGLIIQILALSLFISIPPANFGLVVICVILFAYGYGMVKPFNDAVLAEISEGKTRAGIYTIHNTAVSLLSAVFGFASGFLYEKKPALIYLISIAILMICIGFLIKVISHEKEE